MIDGVPSTRDVPEGLDSVSAPAGNLGDKVVVRIYQVRDKVARGEIKNICKTGLGKGERVPVAVQRQDSTGKLIVDGLDNVPVDLSEPVVIGGTATVELEETNGPLRGEIVDLDFIPQVGDEFKMDLTRGSDQASTRWDDRRGVRSIKLPDKAVLSNEATIELTEIGEVFKGRIVDLEFDPQTGDRFEMDVTRGSNQAKTRWDDRYDVNSVKLPDKAIASGEAIIELNNVGETFNGRIVDYPCLPDENEIVSAIVSEDSETARCVSSECKIVLNKPAELDGEVDVAIHSGVKISEQVVPPQGKIVSYDQLPSVDDVVNAKTKKGSKIAYTYVGEHPITLFRNASESGYAKIKITKADQTDLNGEVEQFGLNDHSFDEDNGGGNPFNSKQNSRNDEITGGKL